MTTMRDAPHGGQLMVGGNHGNKGGGSLPEIYRQKIRNRVDRPAVWRGIVAILEDPGHPSYPQILRLMIEQGYGKPKESIQIDHFIVGTIALTAPGFRQEGEHIELPPDVAAYQLKRV